MLHFELLSQEIVLIGGIVGVLVVTMAVMARHDWRERRLRAQFAPFKERRLRVTTILWLVSRRQRKLTYRPAEREEV